MSINIDARDLWFWDEESQALTFDQGKYIFEIGASSQDIRGTVEAELNGQFRAELKTVVAQSADIILQPGDQTSTSLSASLSNDSFRTFQSKNQLQKQQPRSCYNR